MIYAKYAKYAKNNLIFLVLCTPPAQKQRHTSAASQVIVLILNRSCSLQVIHPELKHVIGDSMLAYRHNVLAIGLLQYLWHK